ncbi:hypothetical protein YC2023_009459 [Brassica napus]
MSISRPRLLLTFKHNHNEDNELIFFSSPHTSQVSNDGSSMASKHEMTDMDQMDFTNTKSTMMKEIFQKLIITAKLKSQT